MSTVRVGGAIAPWRILVPVNLDKPYERCYSSIMNKIKRYIGLGWDLPALAYGGRAYNSYGFGTRGKTTWDIVTPVDPTAGTPVGEQTA